MKNFILKTILFTIVSLTSNSAKANFELIIVNNWCTFSTINVYDASSVLLYSYNPIAIGTTTISCLVGVPSYIEITPAGCNPFVTWPAPLTTGVTLFPSCINVAICGGLSATNVVCAYNGPLACLGGDQYQITLN